MRVQIRPHVTSGSVTERGDQQTFADLPPPNAAAPALPVLGEQIDAGRLGNMAGRA